MLTHFDSSEKVQIVTVYETMAGLHRENFGNPAGYTCRASRPPSANPPILVISEDSFPTGRVPYASLVPKIRQRHPNADGAAIRFRIRWWGGEPSVATDMLQALINELNPDCSSTMRGMSLRSRTRTCAASAFDSGMVPRESRGRAIRGKDAMKHRGRFNFSRTGSAEMLGDNVRMAATPVEGTARKLVTRKCVRTMHKSEDRGDSRKDGAFMTSGGVESRHVTEWLIQCTESITTARREANISSRISDRPTRRPLLPSTPARVSSDRLSDPYPGEGVSDCSTPGGRLLSVNRL